MDLSLNKLKEAISIRTQIEILERRLAGIFGGTGGGSGTGGGGGGAAVRMRARVAAGVPCLQLHAPSFQLRPRLVGQSVVVAVAAVRVNTQGSQAGKA